MSWKSWAVGACILGANLVGCGGDDAGTPDPDMGTVLDLGNRDGGGDMGGNTDMGTTPDMSTPVDMGADAGGPTACDPYDPTSCPADEAGMRKCTTVLRGEGETATLGFECVSAVAAADRVGLDVVCARFSRDTGDGGMYDPCRQGLFCWIDPNSPTLSRCQEMCGGDGAPDCAVDEFCPLLSDDPARFGVCQPTDGCDPNAQTGCAEGEGCYWVFGGAGIPIGNCFGFSPPDGGTGAPGEACQFIDSCQPGTQCFPEIFADGGSGDENLCRVLCDPTAETSVCAEGQTCTSLINDDVDGGIPDAGIAIPNIGTCQ